MVTMDALPTSLASHGDDNVESVCAIIWQTSGRCVVSKALTRIDKEEILHSTRHDHQGHEIMPSRLLGNDSITKSARASLVRNRTHLHALRGSVLCWVGQGLPRVGHRLEELDLGQRFQLEDPKPTAEIGNCHVFNVLGYFARQS